MKDKPQVKEIKREGDDFPIELKNIPDSPHSIFIKGKLSVSNRKTAIVGTRKASDFGQKTAFEFASKLSSEGFLIVSGLAFGIDTSAHKGALKSEGKTWAVLGNGLDSIYPSSNASLAEKIIETGGCLLSEYPNGTPSYPGNFILRNRIISGLCQAVIVIESPEKSGALATARYAAEQGREVFVVPGPINSPNFAGSHKLIRDGARLVSSPEDVLDDLGIEIKKNELNLEYGLSEIQKEIIQALRSSQVPLNIDNISELTKLKTQEVISQITGLLLNNIVSENNQGKYFLK